jgi:hypothetical protein
MQKPLIWTGAAIAAIGLVALVFVVMPYVQWDPTATSMAPYSPLTLLIAALIGGIGLAAGFALIGVGIGRWQAPTREQTLPLGQTRNSNEV